MSFAVTVTLTGMPAVVAPGVEMVNTEATAAFTVIVAVVPVMAAFTVSVAVIVLLPAVFSVTANVPEPFVSVELAGSTAEPSVLVKCTVPE